MAVVRTRLAVTVVSRRLNRPRGVPGRIGRVGHRLMVLVRGVFWRGRVHTWLVHIGRPREAARQALLFQYSSIVPV